MMRSKLPRASQRHLHVATSKAWRDVDETRPLLPAPEAPRWSALIVEPRMEAKAASALQEAGPGSGAIGLALLRLEQLGPDAAATGPLVAGDAVLIPAPPPWLQLELHE